MKRLNQAKKERDRLRKELQARNIKFDKKGMNVKCQVSAMSKILAPTK